MTDIGKIEFNANQTTATRSGWPQPKTKEELEEERNTSVWERMAQSGGTEKAMKKEKPTDNFGPIAKSLLPKTTINSEIPVMDKQVGGSHYKQYKIQPYEFFIVNQIPHHKAAIIRRILRYDHPTGKGLEDLQKISHEIEMIIQLENWESIEESEIDTQTEEKACKCK